MPDDSAGEKTEPPTERRRQEARQQGRVSKSMDLSAAVMLLGGLLGICLLGPRLFDSLSELMRHCLSSESPLPLQAEAIQRELQGNLRHFVSLVGPFLAVMAALAVGVNLLQVGPVFSFHPLQPSLSKLDPIQGLQRIFSKQGLMRLAQSLFKVAVVALVATWVIRGEFGRLELLSVLGFWEIVRYGSGAVLSLAIKLGLALLVLAVIDYAFQRWQYEQELRMTKQEVKDEMKRMEGDPAIRNRRRQIQRQLAYQRMAQAVPDADVVVTNPTEVAVALRYDSETMAAPKLVAKGEGYVAQRIRQIAAAHGVPIVERPPLARTLYRTVAIDQEVPPEFFRAVAELLAYVYQLKGRRVSA